MESGFLNKLSGKQRESNPLDRLVLERLVNGYLERHLEDIATHYMKNKEDKRFTFGWGYISWGLRDEVSSYVRRVNSLLEEILQSNIPEIEVQRNAFLSLRKDFVLYSDLIIMLGAELDVEINTSIKAYNVWCTLEKESFAINMAKYVAIRKEGTPTNELVDILVRFISKLKEERYVLQQIASLCIRKIDMPQSMTYTLLVKNCVDAEEKYTKEKLSVQRSLEKMACEALLARLDTNESRFVLTKESVKSTIHTPIDECFYVVALYEDTHHISLHKLLRVCKASYAAVFKAMNERLARNGIFHPSMIKIWSPPSSVEAIVTKHEFLARRRRETFIMATKELAEKVRIQCRAEFFLGADSPVEPNKVKIVRASMTRANKNALAAAFGVGVHYMDTLFALQTCYNHIYFEFRGTGEEKSSHLYKWDAENASSIVFKLPGDEENCYKFSFVVRHIINKKDNKDYGFD